MKAMALALSFVTALTPVAGQAPVVEAPAIEQSVVATAEEDVLGDYIEGVIKDSDVMSQEMAGIVDNYVKDVVNSANDVATGKKTGKEFAKDIEKKSEDMADLLESVGDAYGKVQEKNGNTFGNKFDKETAKTIYNVVTKSLGRFR